MNMLSSPLERIVENDLSISGETSESAFDGSQDLFDLTKRLPDMRDQLISQGLILRSMQDNSTDAHNELLSELLLQQD